MDSSCLVPGLINCYIWRGMHNGWYFSGQQFCGVWWNSTPTKTRLVKTKESMSIPILTHTQQARKPQIEHSDGHYEEKICKKKTSFWGAQCRNAEKLQICESPQSLVRLLEHWIGIPLKNQRFWLHPQEGDISASIYPAIVLRGEAPLLPKLIYN